VTLSVSSFVPSTLNVRSFSHETATIPSSAPGRELVASGLERQSGQLGQLSRDLFAEPRSASGFVGAAVKGVRRASEELVGELRVVDGAGHRDRPDQSGEG
jgi:hypothetical protein